MAHELSQNVFGQVEMAYHGQTPWHGLGQVVDANASIEQWKEASGLTWTYEKSDIKFETPQFQYLNGGIPTAGKKLNTYPGQVIWRSDDQRALATVGNGYKLVQPGEILDFYKDLVADAGFRIETVGSLREGRRIWALANTNHSTSIVEGDALKSYLLLVTSCDGSLATTAQFTSVRVVCQNTLSMSLHEKDGKKVKVRHSSIFDPAKMKEKLGIMSADTFADFEVVMKSLSKQKMDHIKADQFLKSLLTTASQHGDVTKTPGYSKIMELFNGAGKGSRMDGVQGTSWGLLNAVTEYVDHHQRAQSRDNRVNSAWFAAGASLKGKALDLLQVM